MSFSLLSTCIFLIVFHKSCGFHKLLKSNNFLLADFMDIITLKL